RLVPSSAIRPPPWSTRFPYTTLFRSWDVTARDPTLLVYLKSYRNTIPVPRHWSQKRKYLQGKRGIEKPPFELPDFIASTGISRIDRKSTRLNSSHVKISYAVFCLTKK